MIIFVKLISRKNLHFYFYDKYFYSQAKKVTRFVSTVKVVESNFQTFPNSFPTKEQAEEAAAAMAIAKLDISSHTTNSTNNNR